MDMMMRFAYKRMLGQIKNTIGKSYEEGRLVFSAENKNNVEYTDKEGARKILTIDGCAALLWDKFNSQIAGATSSMAGATGGMQANLGILGISPDDIRGIILELRDKTIRRHK